MSYNHLDDCPRFMAKVEKDRRGPKDGGPMGLGAARILGIDISGVPIVEPVFIVTPRYSPPESPNADLTGSLKPEKGWD